jgi:hypothetical protein
MKHKHKTLFLIKQFPINTPLVNVIQNMLTKLRNRNSKKGKWMEANLYKEAVNDQVPNR